MKDNTGDSSTERAFQKLLELPVGSKTADSEAVKTVMSQMGDYDFTGEIREQDRQFQETKIFYL